MTRAEARAYNRGVTDVLDLARRAAVAISARRTRPIAEGFAVEALDELATIGRELLLAEKELAPPCPK